MVRHNVKTIISEVTVGNKTISLIQYNTENMSSEFWRVNIRHVSDGRETSIPFESERQARMVFRSHVQF